MSQDADYVDVSNREFLKTVFGKSAPVALVAAFSDPPDQIKDPRLAWSAHCANDEPGKRRWQVKHGAHEKNTYFTISTFEPQEEDGQQKYRRRKALFEACHVVVIDDVGDTSQEDAAERGIKVDRVAFDLLYDLQPSYELETSPGNCQWGLLLKEPETRRWAVEQLVDGMIAKGLTQDGTDPGMKGVTRFVRLPQGVNNKTKYVEALGEPWRVRMRSWRPERTFTVDELANLFGIKLIEPGTAVDRAAPADRPAPTDDARLEAMIDAGLIHSTDQANPYKHYMVCFNAHAHSDRADEPEAVYFAAGNVDEAGNYYPHGGYKCHHGHCEKLGIKDLETWLMEEGHYSPPGRRSPEEAFAHLDLDTGGLAEREGRMPPSDVRRHMELTEAGSPKNTSLNIRTFLTLDQHVPTIEFNAFYVYPTLNRQRMRDVDIFHLKHQAIDNYGVEFSTVKMQETVEVVADNNSFDPVTEYLESLIWDGTERLSTWLLDFAGVEDSVYAREVGRKVLIAAVARSFDPGAKFDNMMILEGEQGTGKSAIIRDLCPYQDWFLDSHLPIGKPKDAAEMLRGKLIVEIAELASFRKTEVEPLKAFLSQQQDDYRPPWGRQTRTYPRRCIFIGTTNESQYLQDTTGARRFWPIKTHGEIAWRRMREERDQIWAEAVQAYRRGEDLNLGTRAHKQAQREAELRYDEDDWSSIIDLYLSENPDIQFTTGAALAFNAFGIPADKFNRGEQRRLGAIMRRRGWDRKPGYIPDPDAKGATQLKQVQGYHRPRNSMPLKAQLENAGLADLLK